MITTIELCSICAQHTTSFDHYSCTHQMFFLSLTFVFLGEDVSSLSEWFVLMRFLWVVRFGHFKPRDQVNWLLFRENFLCNFPRPMCEFELPARHRNFLLVNSSPLSPRGWISEIPWEWCLEDASGVDTVQLYRIHWRDARKDSLGWYCTEFIGEWCSEDALEMPCNAAWIWGWRAMLLDRVFRGRGVRGKCCCWEAKLLGRYLGMWYGECMREEQCGTHQDLS